MVPVNIRAGAEQLALGNRITSLFVHLPVAEETPLARYAKTLEETTRLKHGDQALGGRTLLQLTTSRPRCSTRRSRGPCSPPGCST